MKTRPLPTFLTVARAAAKREFLSHRVNRFLHAHVLLVLIAGLLPLLTPGDAFTRGASWWLLHAVLYAISLSALLLGLSSAQAEVEEFNWLLGQPAGVAPWLAGKTAALTILVGGATALLALPTIVVGGFSRELIIVALGGSGAAAVCASAGLALGFWIRDSVRGLIGAVGVWFVLLFGVDLFLLAVAGVPSIQQQPNVWVAALMSNPLDAFRVTVLFSIEHAAFTGIDAGQLTGWWIAHSLSWLSIILGLWWSGSAALAWLGARRRTDG